MFLKKIVFLSRKRTQQFMKIRFLLFLIFTVKIFFLSAQNKKVDSLRNIINSVKNNKEIIKAYIALSDYYYYSLPDSADFFLKRALSEAEKIKDLKLKAEILKKTGILDNERGRINIAKNNFKNLLLIAEKLNDTSLMISAKGNLGNSYLNTGEYDNAILYFTDVIKLAEETNNIKVAALANGAMGNLYLTIKDYEKSLNYYKKSYDYFKILKYDNGIALSLMNTATVSANLGRYKEAVENYNKADKIFKKEKNLLNSAKCLSGIAKVYFKTKNYIKAVKSEKKALETYKAFDSKMDISYAYGIIGENYFNLKQYKTAVAYLDSAYKTISEESKNYSKLETYTDKLRICYDSIGDYKKAYEYALLNRMYYDSVFDIESKKKFSELELKFETSEKERQIELLKKNEEILSKENKNRLIILISLLVLLILSGFIFLLIYNRHKLKAGIKESELENKLLRVQMNPHFIFNALSSIEYFIYKNDLEKSSLYIANFAKLMRLILESSRKELISIESEKEILSYYVDFQKLRVNFPVKFNITISDNIDSENTLIPPMIIQPFVENAFKHGFKENTKEALIDVSFTLKNKFIFVKITDNGTGIEQPNKETSRKKHRSLSLKITEERLQNLFGKKAKKHGVLTIIDLSKKDKNLHGTEITFKLPYIEEF